MLERRLLGLLAAVAAPGGEQVPPHIADRIERSWRLGAPILVAEVIGAVPGEQALVQETDRQQAAAAVLPGHGGLQQRTEVSRLTEEKPEAPVDLVVWIPFGQGI